jgi:serine protease inhibitor
MLVADTKPAATAINDLGVDLYRMLAGGDANLCLSPYSIQVALAMTFAGADGQTRAEMAKALHYPEEGTSIHDAFAELKYSLDAAVAKSVERSKELKCDPMTFDVANRLFGQKGVDFLSPFLELIKNLYGAPLEQVDFIANADQATAVINSWVEDQTHKRIKNLIPPRALNATTRLVLVNAIYMKAPWTDPFQVGGTKPEPFHVHGASTGTDVPTMSRSAKFGYSKEDGFTAVTIPYSTGDLQFLVIVPDEVNGLQTVEAKLTGDLLAGCANSPQREVILHLPKFKLEPPTAPLGSLLKQLGMRSAFDDPPGSANFDRMAARRPGDYLAISDVFHKTFISVDEQGTEAAAATAVGMRAMAAIVRPEQPIEVKIDRPFLFAILHRPSSACIFLGRVTDPKE